MPDILDHRIEGGDGTQLHVVETGRRDGHPILFLHGFSQCSLAWTRQLHSDLADHHRLLAMDLRGHGLSARPDTGYADSKAWAEDVAAAIRRLRLRAPILCGWSYGALVILDYLRHFGEAEVGGIHFVGAVTRLGGEQAMAALSPEFAALIPGLLAGDAERNVENMSALARLCFDDLPASDLYRMLGYSLSVPPYVRSALFARTLDNDDLLATLRKPLLITHGSRDAIVRPEVVEQHHRLVPHAQVHWMDGCGHAPFWDRADAFNRRLRRFAADLDAGTQPKPDAEPVGQPRHR